ncbi:hypothetical protein acsn021_06540 [Anaerocolumna cellulosilytica]|uniref:Uncharacterized protein n=1 Tax=Anaerocolumna cellulosilytica TaxID=433286 RepID=A0A6S6R0E8_9FIRM|nr:hypothetical protein [Anaerocolumna cellulosilytica]MBB5197691.1 hypothetical protein [Anaerocolumna cellulosilytica]BCJ93085.1 hypothetical protein acsn021_06540 [Anaerocolumna cellulosilytica]
MANLLIAGKMDKKMLVYPLLRVLSIEGDVLFITDDISFNRLFDGTQSGKHQNITLYVGNAVPSGRNESELYKNVLVVSEKINSEELKRYDAALIVYGPDYSFYGQDLIEVMEKINDLNNAGHVRAVLQSIYPLKAAGNIMIRKPEHYFYISKVEEMKELLPCKDICVEKLLINTFADALNIKPKQFANLLRLKPYDVSKKVIAKSFL